MQQYEKVNPSHPDKVADRIAGAMVDLAYRREENPRIAVEVLIGHGECTVLAETSVHFAEREVAEIVQRMVFGESAEGEDSRRDAEEGEDSGEDAEKDVGAKKKDGKIRVHYLEVPQDEFLAGNQEGGIRCGDNGIFLGVPLSPQEKRLSGFSRKLYREFRTDGKFMINRVDSERDNYYICQSCAGEKELTEAARKLIRSTDRIAALNPLGEWTGGIEVDSGATNRKLGSDLGQGVTGGGLHGKDLSKADVALTIYAHLRAQELGRKVEYLCAIGDEVVDGRPYAEIVGIARKYIEKLGGFEKLAEWGLI